MTIKKRNVAAAIIFSILTCGIYGIYWQVSIVDDANKISKNENAKSGILVFLLSLITCEIYWLFWMFKAGEMIDKARTEKGMPSSSRGLVYLLLSIFGLGLVAMAILQSDINVLAEEDKVENIVEEPKDEDDQER